MPPAQSHQAPDADSAAHDAPPTKRDLTSWWKQFKNNTRKKDEDKALPPPENPGIFGIPLQTSIRYANVAISLFDENGKSFTYGYVPIVVAKCGVFLKEKATEIEGIFRLAGAERRIKELQVIFNSPDRYGKGLDWTGYTVHDAANILRRYLNQLPEPIVPFAFYHRFRDPLKGHQSEAVGEMDLQEPATGGFDVEKTIKTYQQLITELPALNRQLLLYILDLLAVFASKSDINRMTSPNLSAIFQPGLLGLREHDMMPNEYRLSQDVLIFLIENQDSFLVGMQGTAADEKTIKDVQSGGAHHQANSSTSSGASRVRSGVGRSASNASAGAESVRKFGGVRRNVSTSSRRSRQSGHTPSPVTPPESPFVPGGKSGVHRSNTVPSKKSPSPAVGASTSRFSTPRDAAQPYADSQVAPPSGGAQNATGGEGRPKERLSPHLRPVDKRTSSGDRGMRMEMPQNSLPTGSPGGTPSKERPFSSVFKQSPTAGELKDGRRPNKLQKKRPEGGTLGAKSSNASLGGPNQPPSPSHGSFAARLPAQTDAQRLDASAQMLEQVNEHQQEVVLPPEEAKAGLTKESQMTNVEPEGTVAGEASQPRQQLKEFPQRDSTATIKAPQAAAPAGKSPAGSMHSRSTGNEKEAATMQENGETAERNDSVPTVEKKDRRHSRWRLSTSARKEAREAKHEHAAGFGSASGAELSTSTVGSYEKPRKSVSEETAQGGGQHERDTSTGGEKKSLTGWFKGKLQERREREEAKERQKSPPPSRERMESPSRANVGSAPMPTLTETMEQSAAPDASRQGSSAPVQAGLDVRATVADQA